MITPTVLFWAWTTMLVCGLTALMVLGLVLAATVDKAKAMREHTGAWVILFVASGYAVILSVKLVSLTQQAYQVAGGWL